MYRYTVGLRSRFQSQHHKFSQLHAAMLLLLAILPVVKSTCDVGYVHTAASSVLPSRPEAVLGLRFGALEAGCDAVDVATASAPPELSWAAEEGKLYVVLMTDPDAPSAKDPTAAEWLHWLVVNVEGGDVSTDDVLTPYAGPTPPKGSGPHRYVLSVYRQGGPIRLPPIASRANFSTSGFVEQNSLQGPVAASFFRAENA